MKHNLKTLKDIAGAGLNYNKEDYTFEGLKVDSKSNLSKYNKLYTEDRLLREVAREWISELQNEARLDCYEHYTIDWIENFFNLNDEVIDNE